MPRARAPYPLAALRALALHTQRLATPNGAEPEPSPEAVYQTVEALGCVQIDTLAMAERAHVLTLWSRFGSRYDPATLDALAFDPAQRRLFEYWMHAAAYIPLKHYRYFTPAMKRRAKTTSVWWQRFFEKPGAREALAGVLKHIENHGAARAADFENPGKRGAWWDWKPAKIALEHHYNRGALMIANRVKFQRVYDLKERVLPEWVDTKPVSEAQAYRFFVEQAARQIGVGRAKDIAAYAYLMKPAQEPMKAMLKNGTLRSIQGESQGGAVMEWIVHRDHLPLLDQAADGALPAPARTTFLNPFDSLLWARGRETLLFGFEFKLEMYVPEPKRLYGYYSMPILWRDRLVGRFDPKVDRKAGTLTLRSLWLEPSATLDEEMIKEVAGALRDFMQFHKARELIIERSEPPLFGEMIRRAL